MANSISVVMATYNGALYIEEQLRSILVQLRNNDEIIIVDDASSDSTLVIVNNFGDRRIRVHRNNNNIGALRSFEKAISLASGDLIFLSDQDDVWHLNKIRKVTEVYAMFRDVTLVLSDARVIDKNGDEILNSFFKMRGGFVPDILSNIIKNRYLGCVMTFRRSLIDKILPFPPAIPQHDMWIGLVNCIYGKPYYISTPLIDYRRHEFNASLASSNKRGSVLQMINWRLSLLVGLIGRIYFLLKR